MELLCFKCGDSYLHIIDDKFQLASINNASVYSHADIDKVKKYFQLFRVQLEDLKVIKLVISEEEINL